MSHKQKKRPKTAHKKYGDRAARIGAYVSPEAKEGLYRMADDLNISFNELMERLGRREMLGWDNFIPIIDSEGPGSQRR
jgi:hypothetical protein